MRLFLQANDTFFFRDGRPFTKGDQSEGYSIFPPLPSTILGALRTAYIAEHGDLSSFYYGKMKEIIGTPKPDSLGSMHLKGVFLADRNRESRIYYPIPLDLVTKNKEKENKLYVLERSPEKSNFISNSPLNHHLRWDKEDEDVESETSGRLIHLYFRQYLLGKKTTFRLNSIENFVCDEPKIGIERDYKTLTSKDNMLYRINMRRFQSLKTDMSELGFVVDYKCAEKLSKNGLLKLGGEAKSFTYERSSHNPDPLIKEEDMQALKDSIRSSRAFKLYFATPAIFENGWLPKWIHKNTDKDTYNAEYKSLSFDMRTAAVGKPIAIGGWDMKKNMPKPTRQAIPAGSVYYFKVPNQTCVDTIVKTFHYKNISDYQAAEGFGLCFVGIAEGDSS